MCGADRRPPWPARSSFANLMRAVTRSVQRSGGEMAYVLVGALMKLGPVVRRAGPGPRTIVDQIKRWSANKRSSAEDDKRWIAGCGTNHMLQPEYPATCTCTMAQSVHNACADNAPSYASQGNAVSQTSAPPRRGFFVPIPCPWIDRRTLSSRRRVMSRWATVLAQSAAHPYTPHKQAEEETPARSSRHHRTESA